MIVLLTILTLGSAGQVMASDLATPRSGEITLAATPGLSAQGPGLLLVASWWQDAYGQLESFLGTRQRMLQFGAVGMGLALFIIWYRR